MYPRSAREVEHKAGYIRLRLFAPKEEGVARGGRGCGVNRVKVLALLIDHPDALQGP